MHSFWTSDIAAWQHLPESTRWTVHEELELTVVGPIRGAVVADDTLVRLGKKPYPTQVWPRGFKIPRR